MAPLIVEDYCMIGDDVSITSSGSSSSSMMMMDVEETPSAKSVPQQASPQQQQQQRKHISFSEHSEEYDVLSRYDMTGEEVAAAWFDRFELRQFKTTAKSEAKLVDRGLYTNNNADSCTRGLECRTFDGTRQKRQRRLNAAAAVFMELDQQDEMGCGVDEERLADAYYHWSQPCLVAAQMIALRDHRDAIDCWEPPQQQSQKVATTATATATATTTASAAITIVDQSLFSGSSFQGILASSAA
eukprot:CAMPEP_0113482254 /NCGR_PEP_ID=MMETSP0014_2-20120614/22824_1 /TAXON_ID=2857 /ORGANISM="Nitzschia sp." /LENGTH=242 /DNA_ID=CAMNT_0000375765 /DNA_START=271 /DNA_END=999 /DNA_ORIENTATION=+ /assembly_acc=CAM_ASM_000159